MKSLRKAFTGLARMSCGLPICSMRPMDMTTIKGSDREVFVVGHLDGDRNRRGLTPDLALDDGNRPELSHRAGVAEPDAVRECPADVGQGHGQDGEPA